MQHAAEGIGGVRTATEPEHEGVAPIVEWLGSLRDGELRLVPRVVHRHHDARQQRDHDDGHDPFEVDPVANMGCRSGHVGRREQQRVDRLEGRVQPRQRRPLGKPGRGFGEASTERPHSPLPLDVIEHSTQQRPVLDLPRIGERTHRKVFLQELQAPQAFRLLDVLGGQRPQEV